MEQDQRIAALPKTGELKTTVQEYQPGYSAYFDEASNEGRRTIQQYFNVVKKRLPLILALTLLVTIAAAFYMWRQPTQYLSSMELLIEPRKPRVTDKSPININFGGDQNYLNTQLQLLSNGEIMRDVIIELGLYKDPNLFAHESRGFGTLFGGNTPSDGSNVMPLVTETSTGDGKTAEVILTPEEEARASLYAGKFPLTAYPKRRTNLVTLSVRSTNSKLAPIVVNKAAEVFQRKDADRELQGSKRAVADLGTSIEELERTINEQEAQLITAKSLSDYRSRTKGKISPQAASAASARRG
jgi:Uncharacterized protein involved in exopolysaccharide biosynthesis